MGRLADAAEQGPKALLLDQPTDSLSCRRQGHPGSPGAGTFIRSCMPHGVRHPGGETDRQSPCRGRAARILARTIRMPPVSSIWIPGRRWAPALGHPTVRNPVGGHARERHGGACRRGPDHQSAGGYGCPGASVLYLGITLSDERGEGERAHCRRSVFTETTIDCKAVPPQIALFCRGPAVLARPMGASWRLGDTGWSSGREGVPCRRIMSISTAVSTWPMPSR